MARSPRPGCWRPARTSSSSSGDLIGGECAYWACIPSKTLLRGTDAVAQANRAPGAVGARLDWPALRDYRDYMIRGLDDAGQVEGYAKQGATVIKAAATITGPHTVEAGDREQSSR